MRIKFRRGGQRKFLNLVVVKLNVVSLRGILQFGFDVKYSTLKNYYNESRLLPEEFFDDLCEVSGIDKSDLEFEYLSENWGRVKGGKLGKRGFNIRDYLSAIKDFFLGKIPYSFLVSIRDKSKIAEIVFESRDFEKFTEFLYSFFDDKVLVENRLKHENKHHEINLKYGVSSKFILRSYVRNGKKVYRPAVLSTSNSLMSRWSLKKHWDYFYEQTSMSDASDTDREINKVLLEVREFVEGKNDPTCALRKYPSG